MKSKPVLPINELVNEIRKKGIQIDDENFVSEVLARLNYQRLLAYRNKFLLSQNLEVYKEGTNFNDIYRLYKFDRELKFILQKNIESIELMMRTLISHHLGITYGVHGHLDQTNFKNIEYHNIFKFSLFEKTDRSKATHKKHLMVKYHHDNYIDELPIYKAVELLTFGELSKFFLNLKDEKDDVDNKKMIVERLKTLDHKINNKTLSSWLKSLVDVRNMCAHHELLYCRKFEISSIARPQWKEAIVIKNQGKEIFSVYGIILILKSTSLDREVYDDTINSLKLLFEQYSDIILPKDINFSDNWDK